MCATSQPKLSKRQKNAPNGTIYLDFRHFGRLYNFGSKVGHETWQIQFLEEFGFFTYLSGTATPSFMIHSRSLPIGLLIEVSFVYESHVVSVYQVKIFGSKYAVQ